MKKILAASIAIIASASLMFVSAPAQASDLKTKAILCQATADPGHYNLISVAKDSLINGNGSSRGINVNDIVPPFEYNFGGDNVGVFPGQGIDAGGSYGPSSAQFLKDGCKASSNEVTPVLGGPVQGFCSSVAGTAPKAVQTPGSGVTASDATYSNGVWTIVYTKPVNTPFQTYVWADGFTGTQTITVAAPNASDPMWNAELQSCNMPETGAAEVLTIAAGAVGILGLGALALFLSRRRQITA